MKSNTRLMFGIAFLAFGLFLSVGAWNTIQSYQGGILSKANLYPVTGAEYPFWMSFSYIVFKVPDYLLNYLILGVFTTTVGITFLVPLLWNRLAGIEDD